jgi:hypothetical protein
VTISDEVADQALVRLARLDLETAWEVFEPLGPINDGMLDRLVVVLEDVKSPPRRGLVSGRKYLSPGRPRGAAAWRPQRRFGVDRAGR